MTAFSRTSLPPTLRLSDSGRAPLWLWATSVEPHARSTFTVLQAEPLEAALLEQLQALALLAHDWDSYGGSAPSQAVIEAASRFLVDLNERAREMRLEIGEPKLLATGDGTVGFVWTQPDQDSTLEIVIADEGSVQFVSSRNKVVTQGAVESADEALVLLVR